MLELHSVHAGYGPVKALENVSLRLSENQIVCLLGANGAGKTTTLNCISGVVPISQGRITFNGEDLSGLRVEEIVARGIVQVPEGREIFPQLTVQENLQLGAWIRRHEDYGHDFGRVYEYFPRLKERERQAAGTLSGGEQQMLMVGRALMARPKVLVLDEPSLGLSPLLIEQLFAIIKRVHAEGMPILLVEQNARVALAASDYCYVLENGEIRLHGQAATLTDHPDIQAAYLGS